MAAASRDSFLRESSIHGLRYVSEARHPAARLGWALLITASVALAAVLVYKNWTDWRDSPAVVTNVRPALAAVSFIGVHLFFTMSICQAYLCRSSCYQLSVNMAPQ